MKKITFLSLLVFVITVFTACSESQETSNIKNYYSASLATSANSTAASLKHIINNYMSIYYDYFNSAEINEFDIIIKNGTSTDDTFPEIYKGLYQDYAFENASIKVFYKNGECLGVAYIADRTTPIITGTDCPRFEENGFSDFTWSPNGKQVNSANEVVGLSS